MECDPEDLTAAILSKVKADTERYLGFDVNEAVITIAVRFSAPQLRPVREAAHMADLEALRVMNEPTAAALARA